MAVRAMSSKDLRSVTDGWPYVPGQISVRRIRGADNRIRIQMRVDLGVLQMEVTGRPDGHRPYGQESLLEYHRDRIETYRRRNGSDLGFTLDAQECRELREEAMQYYQRYLANFVLEDYEAVSRDTQRNIEVLDLCGTYAAADGDRVALESYRPYIVMMNSQSKALLAMRQDGFRTALAHVNAGLRSIRDFFVRVGQRDAFRSCGEAHVLRVLRREIKRHLPIDPVRIMRRKLRRAVEQERYEEAARLRDELQSILGERHRQEPQPE